MKNYLRNVGLALDRFLNAVTGGDSNETVSLRAATRATTPPPKKWACVLCKWLSLTVERDHCAKTLDPNAETKNAACIKALVQMIVVVWIIHYTLNKIGGN